jgi:nucleoside-diphosphate-sugar epimerase/2-polyprenyl-3-methyl-5-hydroxy-6-metoxy-1,4-benzoquinol methylase
MNILIIGHDGYIGSRLINYLNCQLENVNIVGCDLQRGENFRDLTKEYLSTFDVVILLAAHSSVKSCVNNFDSLNNNVTYFIEFTKKLNCTQKFIYMSSSSVYGSCHDKEAYETNVLEEPHNEYDFSKRVIDEYILQSNLNYYGLRLGTVSGWSPKMRQELIVNSMVNSAKTQSEIRIYNPKLYRPVLYILDLCRAIHAIIMDNDCHKSGIYNLASFNNSIENIGISISNCLQVPYFIYETDENFKTSYSFSISSEKFKSNFNFNFIGDVSTIVNELYNNITVFEKKVCRICDKSVTPLLDFGEQPLANEYHKCNSTLTTYPLKLMLCENCYHTQLSHVVKPEILYNNYQYVSGTSNTLTRYFKWLANKIDNEVAQTRDKTILEIACNDGTQLDIFKDMNWQTFGVDPASNIVENITRHKVYNDFFSTKFASLFRREHPDIKLNCIVAQNVLAHLDNVMDFMSACNYLMDDDTLLYIQTSQCNMYKNNEFDTIYHEHHSFFSVNSMTTLVEKSGLYLKRVEKTDIHGTSFLFTISKIRLTDEEQQELIDELAHENTVGLHNIEFYKQYATRVKELCTKLLSHLESHREQGYKIIGYGAAAKGNTLLNYLKFKLDYIVDDSELKWNLYTPGMNIPIYSPQMLKNDENNKILLVPLAWNFFDEIQSKVIHILGNKPDLIFIRYFPDIEIKAMKQPVTVISHFYNEAYLLPFWLAHHKDMFTHGIMIDYQSTDNSVDIIKSIAPNWTIITSRNTEFDSKLCDQEVMDIEKTISGWKIALNTTEFLCCDIQSLIAQTDKSIQSMTITCYPMFESFQHEMNKPLDNTKSLVEQRTHGIKDKSRSTRTLHRAPCGNYCQGRHYNRVSPAIVAPQNQAIILWYGYSPFNNEIIQRKLQIQTRMSHHDKIHNLGIEHRVTKSDLINQFNNAQSELIDFSQDDVLCNHFK